MHEGLVVVRHLEAAGARSAVRYHIPHRGKLKVQHGTSLPVQHFRVRSRPAVRVSPGHLLHFKGSPPLLNLFTRSKHSVGSWTPAHRPSSHGPCHGSVLWQEEQRKRLSS